MEELENTNPTTDTPMDNSVNPNEPEVNLENPTAEQGNTDFSQLFSENVAEDAPVQNEPAPSDSTDLQQNLEESANVSEGATEPEVDQQPEINQESEVISQPEAQTPEPQVETPEPDFQKELENTSLDNSQNIQAAQQAEQQQKARLEQQRLAQLKEHESKAKKSGLISGILYGIILTLLLLAAASIFAKDQVINAIDYLNTLVPTNSINNQVIENTQLPENNLSDVEEEEIAEEEIEEENDEEVDTIQQYYNKVDEIRDAEDDQESKTEQLRKILNEVMQENEKLNNLTQYISQKIMDLTINSEEEQIEENIENQENSEELDNPETNNENSEENVEEVLENTEVVEDDKGYTITHVNSEEEANWVMPSHCSDLTCYGENEEFVACTSFRMVETLDEDTSRVSSRGGCKYKDASELVYVEFSDTHNSAEDMPTDSSTATESQPILEENESTQE